MRIAAALAAALAAAALASCVSAPQAPAAGAEASDKLTLAHVERLRAIRPAADAKQAQDYNRQLEQAWKHFIGHKDALPVLRRELAAELARSGRNDFVLLDLGYFLYTRGEPADRDLARRALFTLDPAAEILRYNQQELFEFAHAVAADRDPRILPLLDRAFLRAELSLRLPQHGMTLDEIAASVFLYGAYGTEAEAHLRRQLADRDVARKVLEILVWIGTPASNADVRSAMLAERDYETFVRGATFLMRLGGPQGRFLLLGLDPRGLDPRSAQYYAGIRKAVEATHFAELRRPLDQAPGPAAIPDEELRRLLGAMNAGYGADSRLSPAAVLNSGLPRDFLLEQVLRSRQGMLRRVSPGTLDDVRRANALLNALYYREK